jgi:hypothetical protein
LAVPGLCLIVRNEEDIVGLNVVYHWAAGFRRFAVMDNGSSDVTPRILKRLATVYPIEIVREPSPDYLQDTWATMLAERLRRQGATHCISLDADEFLWPGETPLNRLPVGEDAVPVMIGRQNVLPGSESLAHGSFDQLRSARYRVCKPLGVETRTGADEESEYPMMLRDVVGKVLTPLDGLQSITRGCHDVHHQRTERSTLAGALIRHFPVRSRAKFTEKLAFARQRFGRENGVSKNTSWHIRKWVRQEETGAFDREYETYFLDPRTVARLKSAGTIVDDAFGRDLAYGRGATGNASLF